MNNYYKKTKQTPKNMNLAIIFWNLFNIIFYQSAELKYESQSMTFSFQHLTIFKVYALAQYLFESIPLHWQKNVIFLFSFIYFWLQYQFWVYCLRYSDITKINPRNVPNRRVPIIRMSCIRKRRMLDTISFIFSDICLIF